MKIALLSYSENAGYGGSLQAYALEKAIETRYTDVECEYIRYRIVSHQLIASIKWITRKIVAKICRKDDTPSLTIREYMKIVCGLIRQRSGKNGRNAMRLFREFWELSNYTNPVSRRELKKMCDYDLYIAGSDQIWNCGRLDLDTTFLLDFVNDDTKKGSYAPSIGLKRIPPKYFKKYQKYLSRFRWLSCREKSGADLIADCTGREVENVLDPVFLLSKEQWGERERRPADFSTDVKFIVLYTLADERDYMPYMEAFLQGKNLQLIFINGKDISQNNAVGPAEWLWYLHHAEYVITDSFHATAFSVIFERQFYSRIPEDDHFEEMSVRIVDLLEMLGLQERVVRDRDQMLKLSRIDFSEARRRLNEKRKESFDYLDGMILNG